MYTTGYIESIYNICLHTALGFSRNLGSGISFRTTVLYALYRNEIRPWSPPTLPQVKGEVTMNFSRHWISVSIYYVIIFILLRHFINYTGGWQVVYFIFFVQKIVADGLGPRQFNVNKKRPWPLVYVALLFIIYDIRVMPIENEQFSPPNLSKSHFSFNRVAWPRPLLLSLIISIQP